MKITRRSQDGFLLPTILSLIIIIGILSLSVAILVDTNLQGVTNDIDNQKAFNIAEAGVNYYLWHLSHNQTDYKDGQTTPATPDPQLGYGPYIHNYVDDNAKTPGTFTLWIDPQGGNSTIVKVRSVGKLNGKNVTRTIEALIGAPSFASYSVAGDGALWFGNTETADGPVHSNAGIRMDGTNTSDVTSANTTYTPPGSLGGDGSSHPGVWCSTSVTTPVNCSTRNKNSWQYPVPSIDFNAVSGDLCKMKKTAFADYSATSSLAGLSNACSKTPTTRTNAYLPQRSSSGSYSSTRGYLIELNGDKTYNLSRVNSETDTQSSYTSALGLTPVATNIPIPPSGVIFAEDNVWVRSSPTFHGRVTIGAGRLASASVNAEITIADDVIYSTKNGSDALGLVAEDSITIAPYAPPQSGSFNFEVDAAVIAQTGNVQFPVQYKSSYGNCTRGWKNADQTFSFYGSVATRQTWTWLWSVGGGSCGNAVNDSPNGYISGFKYNTTHYDYNLEYSPPPSFPITSTYNVLSWREVLTKP